MQKIKCIFVDIDGTLMKEGAYFPNSISEANIDALKDYADAGGQIILSTGRDVTETIKVAQYLSKTISPASIPYLICLNGAIIVRFTSEYPSIVTRYFELNACKLVVDYLVKNKYNFFLANSDKELYFTNRLFSKLMFWLLFKDRYEKKYFSEEINLAKIQKVMIFLKLPRVKALRKKLVEKFGSYFYFSSGPRFFIEIIDNRINKWYAAQEVARLLNIEIDNIAVIGNEGNDILSLESAGYGAGVDLREKKHLNWDPEKIQYHTTNKYCEAVANVIRELKRAGRY
ncbi:haloacid dehalogenase [Candidatus Mycoplasma haematobovis]|uniref:Haloacid dehalogenase n=1 Tax=Candidatus Mycoplasma haematobovis TaxID=432608 RepID=A0A1A9QF19_9MOLU|nr:HAD-IIB family hydrolase [Candidatus Mycoplasma haematobovis]OAL10734.1 haloacid dehalogenase [Candidatus Mycoplasma haematobovis]